MMRMSFSIRMATLLLASGRPAAFSPDGTCFAFGMGDEGDLAVARVQRPDECQLAAALSLACKPAKNMVIAKLSAMKIGQTVTVNAFCGGSKDATVNDRGKAKAKFRNVKAPGCEVTATQCAHPVDSCP